jgi:uncharacterized membrane-anchored protein
MRVKRGSFRPLLAIAKATFISVLAASAAAQEGQPPHALNWMHGPVTAPIGGNLAEIDVDDGYVFLDAEGTKKLMELSQNPVSGRELATVAPASEDQNWFIVLEFDASGYVADTEKDDLDADAILESIRQGTEAANEERREKGWETISIVGWHEPPHYDERTHHLSWAVIGESQSGRNVNRIVKLLGRRGVMTATLVSSPEELPFATLATGALLSGYRFQPGNTYAEYVPGSDKLAGYGLTALVVGGTGAALVKSGLLARFWKAIGLALVAVGAALKRLLFGGRSAEHDMESPIA